ncbi:MAG: EAL domain-containing protein [Synergistaceae bacterium]|nr:EAL domain-containing protein [Synergistaceae bacterium]
MASKKNVLIADDLDINRALLAEIFKEEYNIYEAANGAETLEVLRREGKNIALVILDLLMPEIDGFEVLSVMRRQPEIADIPVVVVTAASDPADEVRALELGATDFISKPYVPRVVIGRVRNIIARGEIEAVRLENKILRERTMAQLQLQAILDNMVGCVFLVELGEKPRELFISKGFYDFVGISKEAFEKNGNDFFFSVAEEDRGELLSALQCAAESRESFCVEFRSYKEDGSLMWLHMQGARIEYPESELPVIVAICSDVTNEKLSEQKLKEANARLRVKAYYDPLTSIFNREAFFDMTAELLKKNRGGSYSLITWNIERFKFINELFGKEMGDRILIDLAQLLKKLFGGVGTYGRLEADRFAACLPTALLEPESMVKGLRPCEDFQREQYEIVIHAGIYEITDCDMPIDQMCDRANLALRSVKGKYMQRYASFTENMRLPLLIEQQVVREMNQAVEGGQFRAWLQPQYDHSTGKIIGAEALARWVHPVRGLISPAEFIPVFEKNGFIAALDEYIWEQVCAMIRRWLDEGRPVVPVSVNLSRVDTYNPLLEKTLLGLIKKYDIPIELLRLEITESAYVENPEQLISVLSSLRERGFFIEMDDFGSGFSSLNSLKDMPLDLLKLDLKFLLGEDRYERGGSILASLVRMAKRLGLPVIAEGVETQAQADFLLTIGCRIVQGYFYAKPMPVEDFERLIELSVFSPQLPDRSIRAKGDLDIEGLWRPDSQTSLFLNFIPWPAVIFSNNNGTFEIMLANKRFIKLLRDCGHADADYMFRLSEYMCDPERFREQIDLIRECAQERSFFMRWKTPGDSQALLMRCRAAMIAESSEQQIFFAALGTAPESDGEIRQH